MSPESRTLTTLYPGFYATLKGEVAAKSASRAVQVNFRPGNLQTSRNFFPSLMRPFVRTKSQFVFKRSPSPSCFHDSGVYFRQSIGKESLRQKLISWKERSHSSEARECGQLLRTDPPSILFHQNHIVGRFDENSLTAFNYIPEKYLVQFIHRHLQEE